MTLLSFAAAIAATLSPGSVAEADELRVAAGDHRRAQTPIGDPDDDEGGIEEDEDEEDDLDDDDEEPMQLREPPGT